MQVAPIDVVGLCDVDQHMAAEAAALTPDRHLENARLLTEIILFQGPGSCWSWSAPDHGNAYL